MSHTELITAFQEDVARAYFDLPESKGFLPAGGAALIALGAVERVTDEFVRLSVTGAGDRIEVDLGIDASLLLPPTVTFLRPTIGLEESAGRKTLALFGRAAPRDFVDVFNLARRFGKPKLLELAAERDLGFDRRVFGQPARLVNQVNARQFPIDEDAVPDLVAFFNVWSEELRDE